MAKRAVNKAVPPWDTGCKVTTLVGGYAAMNEMLKQLENLIDDANASTNDPGAPYFVGTQFSVLCPRNAKYDILPTASPLAPVHMSAAAGPSPGQDCAFLRSSSLGSIARKRRASRYGCILQSHFSQLCA